ncbi:hypothetical protein GCM10022245_67890 [Streptomyces mayteni]
MARRLRLLGTNSGNDGCPTPYEDLDTGEVLVQGHEATDPDDIAQLRNVRDGEAFVIVPRELLVDFSPKETERTPQIIEFADFGNMFRTLEHTAWRLESRKVYRSDEETETYRRFVRGEDPGYDLEHPWCVSRREQAALGKRFERVRTVDRPPTTDHRAALPSRRRSPPELRGRRGHPQPVA